jgi:hypothetical protein
MYIGENVVKKFCYQLGFSRSEATFRRYFGFDPFKLQNGGSDRIAHGQKRVLEILTSIAHRWQEEVRQEHLEGVVTQGELVGSSASTHILLWQSHRQCTEKFFAARAKSARLFAKELGFKEVPTHPRDFLQRGLIPRLTL